MFNLNVRKSVKNVLVDHLHSDMNDIIGCVEN